jgi:hypothetical protein
MAAGTTKNAMTLLRQLERARRRLQRFIVASEAKRQATRKSQLMALIQPQR